MYLAFGLQSIFLQSVTDGFGNNSRTYTFNLLVINSLWLFAGGAIARYSARGNILFSVLILAPVVFFVFSSVNSSYLIDYLAISEILGETVNHLYIADHAAYICFLAYGYARKTRPLVLLIMMAILFSLGGRSALYLAPIAILLFELLHLTKKKAIWMIGYALVLGIAVWYANDNFSVNTGDEKSERIIFGSGVQEDNSFVGRVEIMKIASEGLPSQFFIGNPGYIASELGSMGEYIHNLLSVWQFFGFFAFAGFSILLIRALGIIIRKRDVNWNSALHGHSIILLYVLVSVIFSKSITFKLLWFTLGYWMLASPFTANMGFKNLNRDYSEYYQDIAPKKRRRKRKRRPSRSRN